MMLVNAAAPKRSRLVAWAAIACAALVAALALVALSGTKTGLVLSLTAVGGPLAAYATTFAPLVFPFGAYVVLVPFDDILRLPAFGTVTKLIAIASAGAFLLQLLRTRSFAVPNRSILWWVAFYGWMSLSVLWALDQEWALQRMETPWLLFGLYVLVAILPANRRTLWFTVALVVAGGAAAAAYGTYLFHSGINVTTAGRLFIIEDSGEIDPNHFAAALILPISLTLMLLFRVRSFWRISLVALLLLEMAGVVVSGSRGAMLAVGVLFAYWLFRSGRVAALLATAVAASIPFIVLRSSIVDRFSSAIASGGAGRLSIWQVGLAAFKHNWLLGAGYGNFPMAYDRFFFDAFQQHFAHWHRVAHDLPISVGVELGVVGLILLGGAWYGQFRMLRDIERGSDLFDLRIALEGALLGLLATSLFLDIMTYKYTWLAFMLVALTYTAARGRARSSSSWREAAIS
jgi:O-antigen ligase